MRIKTRRKQYTEGKTLTSPHPTRNQDAMEPELQILPAMVFLLLHSGAPTTAATTTLSTAPTIQGWGEGKE
ncbi:hypothetical protein NDU88_007333 [Pleurodeles waltl]|uniref:Uncharacterized protein n=1 Tax=Pleurodeles waltl TaxID=8319 RepID=A0AAV7N355_PLEWA|nr:hypothetical protein NDU88_007333 [Pleurodeles waltl]